MKRDFVGFATFAKKKVLQDVSSGVVLRNARNKKANA